MRLDFFDLQLFINILSTGSLTKGAERSAISLQAASERIKKLQTLVAMIEDDEWKIPDDERTDVLSALAYFSDPEDL